MDGSDPLNNNKDQFFHTTVSRGFFFFKKYRPDINPTIAVLCTIVKYPNQVDWNKLLGLMKYTLETQELCLKFKLDKTSCLKWYVDVEFTLHSYFKSHTGGT